VNGLAETLELAYSRMDQEKADLEEQLEIRTDIHLIALTPSETEGMDAKARMALAKSKSDDEWVLEERDAKTAAGDPSPGPISLRQEIAKLRSQVRELKTILKIADNRRQDLGRLDSTLRLQMESLKVESQLFTSRVPTNTSFDTHGRSSHQTGDDSISGGIEGGMVGDDSFQSLLETTPPTSSESG
jgi:hypothetical protein